MKISISICHMSSGISSKRLLCYISPFSMPSCNTWNFFDPRKVLHRRINCKYSCSSSYMSRTSYIFSPYTSCYICLLAICPYNLEQELLQQLQLLETQDIDNLNKTYPNLQIQSHKVDSNHHHHNCIQGYCWNHHNNHLDSNLVRHNLQEWLGQWLGDQQSMLLGKMVAIDHKRF